MEKRIYDKQTGIHYELQGDYYLPCLTLPEQPKVEISIWGKRHLRYIKQHHKIRYTNLLTSCKITEYLADIDERASRGYVLSVSKTTFRKRRCNRTAQSRRPNAVGCKDEQYPQPSNRDCQRRIDL